MIEVSLARSARESPGLVECFRHEGEECPHCDGSGFRPAKYCSGCGEPAGSISQGTGAPLVEDRRTDGRFYHVRCLPDNSLSMRTGVRRPWRTSGMPLPPSSPLPWTLTSGGWANLSPTAVSATPTVPRLS